MKELIETIAQSLVDHPDHVQVKKNEDERRIVYELTVHESDTGKVIGKQGRIAKAIRTVVYSAAKDQPKRVYVDIQ